MSASLCSNSEPSENLQISACDINGWDNSAKAWKTSDGMWHSLSIKNLQSLNLTIRNFIKIAKLGFDRQWVIAFEGLHFIKNILSSPSSNPDPAHRDITILTWQLMFELVIHNSENQRKIWTECNELLLRQLQQNGIRNDTCRLIVHNVYAIGGYGKHEGTKILKMLLNSFFAMKKATPLKEQGLTTFLEHFIIDEENITSMYLQLTRIEKIALLHFVIDHLTNSSVTGLRSIHISSDLLLSITNDFISKIEFIFNTSLPEHSDVQELFALFEVIAHVSTEPLYRMNTFDFALLLNVVRLFSYVRGTDKDAETTFSTTKRNSNQPLDQIILSTISNLVKDNSDHKSMAREEGLIEILVGFVAKETNRTMYARMVFTLIDMCQTNPLNMESVERIARSIEFTGSQSIDHFLYDMTYKGRRVMELKGK